MEELKELLVEELQDLYHAEGQLVKALPKMAKAANSTELQEAFQTHLEETKGQVERLKQVFELLAVPAKAKPCKGMAGLLEEGQECITEGAEKDPVIADLGLIAAAQKTEHYEISGYGTARAIAEQIGEEEVAALLTETQEEEESTDELLTALAETLMAEAGGEAADDDEEEEEEESEEELEEEEA